MEKNVMNQAVDELKALRRDIEETNELKQTLRREIEEVREILKQNKEFMLSIKTIRDEIEKSCDTVKGYYERMEEFSKSFDIQLDEARKLENKIMMEKMDLLLNRVQSIKMYTNQGIAFESEDVVKKPKTEKSAKRTKQPEKEETLILSQD